MSLHTTIEKFSHHFVVKNPTNTIFPILYTFSSQYTQFGMVYDAKSRKQKWRPVKTFAVYVDRGKEFRFHIGQYAEFIKALEGRYVDKTTYSIIDHADYVADDVVLELQDGWALYENQEAARSFIVDNMSRENNSPLLLMPTGSGKTSVSLITTAELGKRFALIVLATYVDKWVSDIATILKVDRSEIAVIQGSDALARATNYPDSGLTIPKAFVISLTTITKWYKTYEESRNHPKLDNYACMPYDFCEHLGIGTVIFDEAHQHPHAVYKVFTYLHVPKVISLSATLLSKDPTLMRVQSMMYPRQRRFDEIQPERYITVHACVYQIPEFHRARIQTVEHGRTSYSHVAFEKSLLNHRTVWPQYKEMLLDLIDVAYFNEKMEGDKLAIFVGSKKMASVLVEVLKKRHPKLDIRTYIEGDDYANMIDPDIRVTTIISGGTAVDVPGLRATIMTNSIESPISNVQTLGRLRKLKDRDTHFYYLYCSSIPKQVDYHEKKVELFKMRVKEQKQHYLGNIYP